MEASYQPHQLNQGTQRPLEGIRDQYRRAQEELFTNDFYGAESIDKANLLDYKAKVDEYVEMQYLPDTVKYPRIKRP